METTGVFTPLPDGLVETAPGPELAAMLWSVDPARCNGFQLVDAVRAQYRQLCADQARLLTLIYEMAHSRPGQPQTPPARRDGGDGHADTELACALTLSNPAAGALLAMATLVVERAPVLRDAMMSGDLDPPKARMLTSEFSAVDDATVRAVVDQVRADLPRLTLGQLRYQVRCLLLTVDPGGAAERQARSEAQRTVFRSPRPGGTAALTGMDLPVAKAAAAWEHVDAIARATHAAGDPLQRTLDQVRADVFADLLAGVGPARAGSATTPPPAGAVYLHLNLTTLAGLDDHPAELEGFGPVLADIARQTAAQMVDRAQWRFVTTDTDGRLLAEGRLRYRPTASQARFIMARDRTCRAPGCRRPARFCDIDHIRAWSQGGPTTTDNMITLCRRHHRAKHVGGHRIRLTPRGVEWTTPRGHRYVSAPPGTLSMPERLTGRRRP